MPPFSHSRIFGFVAYFDDDVQLNVLRCRADIMLGTNIYFNFILLLYPGYICNVG